MFTREQNPSPEIYKDVIQDLNNSGLKYYHLMNVDQSYHIPSLPYQSSDVEFNSESSVSSTSTTSSKSISSSTSSMTDECGNTVSSSTSCTQETTTVSTVVVDIDESYTCEYEFFPYPASNGFEPISIFKDVPLDIVSICFSIVYMNL